jgi:hypothetical protein
MKSLRKKDGLLAHASMLLLLTTCSVVLWRDTLLKQQLGFKQAQVEDLQLLLDGERNNTLKVGSGLCQCHLAGLQPLFFWHTKAFP